MTKNNISYKKAIAELEKILEEIESENTDFDQMLAKAKRATELLKFCKEKLYSTENEMNEIFNELDKQ